MAAVLTRHPSVPVAYQRANNRAEQRMKTSAHPPPPPPPPLRSSPTLLSPFTPLNNPNGPPSVKATMNYKTFSFVPAAAVFPLAENIQNSCNSNATTRPPSAGSRTPVLHKQHKPSTPKAAVAATHQSHPSLSISPLFASRGDPLTMDDLSDDVDEFGPDPSIPIEIIDVDEVNERVEKKFTQWKTFWKEQQQREPEQQQQQQQETSEQGTSTTTTRAAAEKQLQSKQPQSLSKPRGKSPASVPASVVPPRSTPSPLSALADAVDFYDQTTESEREQIESIIRRMRARREEEEVDPHPYYYYSAANRQYSQPSEHMAYRRQHKEQESQAQQPCTPVAASVWHSPPPRLPRKTRTQAADAARPMSPMFHFEEKESTSVAAQNPFTTQQMHKQKGSDTGNKPESSPPSRPTTSSKKATAFKQQTTHSTPTKQPSSSPSPPSPVIPEQKEFVSSSSPSSSSSSSNIARFWREEASRKPHQHYTVDARQRYHIYVKNKQQQQQQRAASGNSRLNNKDYVRMKRMHNVTLPDDPIQARQLWDQMKEDMWKQWETYQQQQQQHTQATATARTASPAPPSPAPSPPRTSTTTTSTQTQTSSCSIPEYPTLARGSIYSQYTPPSRPASANNNAQRYSTTTTGTSTIHRHAPTPFSSFARPATNAHNSATTTSTSTQNTTSATDATSNSTTPASPFSYMSVRQLKVEMARRGLSLSDCVEKADMIQKLTLYHIQQQQPQQQTQPSQTSHTTQKPHPSSAPPPTPTPIIVSESVDKQHERTLKQVEKWSHNKSIRQLLNDLNHTYITPSSSSTTSNSHTADSSLFLPQSASFNDIARVYKKTLLRVHPDKCCWYDEEKKFRATEIFKIINGKFQEYKAMQEK